MYYQYKKSNKFLEKKLMRFIIFLWNTSIWSLFNEELLPSHVYICYENRRLLLHYLIFFRKINDKQQKKCTFDQQQKAYVSMFL